MNLPFWLSLTPVVAPLLATGLIPVACETGSVVQRALHLYDAQPTSAKETQQHTPKVNWPRVLGLSLTVVVAIFLLCPVPLSWRSTLAYILLNHIRVLFPTLFLFVNAISLPHAAIAIALPRDDDKEQDLLISRQPNGDPRLVPARPRSLTRLASVLVFVATAWLSFWLLPLPHNFWSLEPLEMPRIPDHKALIIHYVGTAAGFLLLLRSLTDSTAHVGHRGRGCASFARLNLLSSVVWSSCIVITLAEVIFRSSKGHEKKVATTTEESFMPPDGILETINLLGFGPVYPLVTLLVIPLFAFLYRYEEAEHRQRNGITDKYGIRLETSQHAYEEAAVACNDHEPAKSIATAATAAAAPKPVSLRRTARLTPGLRICRSGLTRSVAILYVGIQLLTWDVRRLLIKTDWDTWTASPAMIPLPNPVILLSVPLLSLFAAFLARNNEISLWKYREDWEPPTVKAGALDGDDGETAGEFAAGQGDKEADHLLVDVE